MPRWSEALIDFTRSGGYGYSIDRLSKIEQEALIIWGDSDRILGTKPAQQFLDGLSNSRLEWIANCGHVPHLEQAEVTADLIKAFVS